MDLMKGEEWEELRTESRHYYTPGFRNLQTPGDSLQFFLRIGETANQDSRVTQTLQVA